LNRGSRVVRSWLMIVAPLCAFLVAPASASKHNVQAKSGEETHIWNFTAARGLGRLSETLERSSNAVRLYVGQL
jgi:hypothetical protein